MNRYLGLISAILTLAAPYFAKAASAPPPIEAYGRLPAIDMVSLSPSGQKIVSIGDIEGKRYILVRMISGQTLLAAPIEDSKVRDIIWVDENHILINITKSDYWLYETNIVELLVTLSIDLATGKSALLFQNNIKFRIFHSGLLASYVIDGHPYAFIANTPREGLTVGSRLQSDSNAFFTRGYPDLWKIDLSTNHIDLAAHGTQTIDNWVINPDGEVASYSNFDDKSSTWMLFHGETLLLKKVSKRDQINLYGLGRTYGSSIVFDQSDGDKLIEVGADGQLKTLVEGRVLKGLVRSPTTGLLLGVNLDDGQFQMFDPARQANLNAVTRPFAAKHVQIESTTDAVDEVILRTSGKDDSGTFYLVNLKTHRADIIDNDYPGVASDQVGPVSKYLYKASDGLDLDGVLTLPRGRAAKNLPLVVLPHGGPIGISDRVQLDWMAQAFASRGYAVFQPNYRGSGDRGAAFRDAGFGEFGRKMLTDMSDGVSALAKDGLIDPKRACIVGFSYGGYAAMAGITVQQGLYRCAVAGSGLSDLDQMMQWIQDRDGAPSAALTFWREQTGITKPGAPTLRSISPAVLAARADAPLLLIHGTDDSVVPYEQSQRMLNAMKAAGKPVELITTKGEDHWLSHEDTRIATLKAAVDFVQKHNPAD